MKYIPTDTFDDDIPTEPTEKPKKERIFSKKKTLGLYLLFIAIFLFLFIFVI